MHFDRKNVNLSIVSLLFIPVCVAMSTSIAFYDFSILEPYGDSFSSWGYLESACTSSEMRFVLKPITRILCNLPPALSMPIFAVVVMVPSALFCIVWVRGYRIFDARFGFHDSLILGVCGLAMIFCFLSIKENFSVLLHMTLVFALLTNTPMRLLVPLAFIVYGLVHMRSGAASLMIVFTNLWLLCHSLMHFVFGDKSLANRWRRKVFASTATLMVAMVVIAGTNHHKLLLPQIVGKGIVEAVIPGQSENREKLGEIVRHYKQSGEGASWNDEAYKANQNFLGVVDTEKNFITVGVSVLRISSERFLWPFNKGVLASVWSLANCVLFGLAICRLITFGRRSWIYSLSVAGLALGYSVIILVVGFVIPNDNTLLRYVLGVQLVVLVLMRYVEQEWREHFGGKSLERDLA